MSGDLVPVSAVPTASEFAAIEAQAAVLARSSIVPAAYRGKAHDIIAAALYGRELGLSPVVALNRIHVIEGRPTLSAELQLALIRRAGHDLEPLKVGPEGASLRCRRRGSESWVEIEFSMADAALAGLGGKGQWKAYPSQMCWARAVSKAARMMFSDVLVGFSYTPEEMGVDVDPLTGDVHGTARPEVVGRATSTEMRARIMALDVASRAEVATWMKERRLVLGKFGPDGECEMSTFPADRLLELSDVVGSFEQFVVASADGDPPPGVVAVADVGVEPEAAAHPSPPRADSVVVDVEVVDDGETFPDGPEAVALDSGVPATSGQKRSVAMVCREFGWSDDDRRAFVFAVTRGRASGASSCSQVDATVVLDALGAVRTKSLTVAFGEDQDMFAMARGEAGTSVWTAQVEPLNKAGRTWWAARP